MSQYAKNCHAVVKRIYLADIDFNPYRIPCCMVGFTKLVNGFCLPHKYTMVGIYNFRFIGYAGCIGKFRFSNY